MTPDDALLTKLLQGPEAPLIVDSDAVASALHWSRARMQAALRHLSTSTTHEVNGVQINPWAKTTPDVLAAYLYPHGYVSGEMALSVHNVLSQMPTLIVVVDGTQAPHGRQKMTNQTAIESWTPILQWSAHTTDLSWALPVASPAQALLDWAYHRWYQAGQNLDRLASFLDDCDQDDVEHDLTMFASQADHSLVETLARTILSTWPGGENRFPNTHPGHSE